MADELIPGSNPTPTPNPPAPTGSRVKSIACEFCECTLAPNGDYIALSEKAKTLRAQSEAIDGLKATIESLRADVRAAEEQVREARALVKPADKLFSW